MHFQQKDKLEFLQNYKNTGIGLCLKVHFVLSKWFGNCMFYLFFIILKVLQSYFADHLQKNKENE